MEFKYSSSNRKCEFTETVAHHPKEDVNKAVCDAFDELRLSVFEEEILHPSEECHRQSWLCSKSKNVDIINSYHMFCYLCSKHAYSRSVPTDINSFFQHHINTEYHRECRSMVPHSEEMIVWNEKWKTGECNACHMPEILAIVIDQDDHCSPSAVFNEHYCDWDKHLRENNEEFVWKMNLLKKYCKLSLFREKFIEPLNVGSICKICCLTVPWSGEEVKNHLGSMTHLNQFCHLVWNKFSLSAKELLNGFNQEMVIRWIYRCVFKHPMTCSDFESTKLLSTILSRDPVSLISSLSPGQYCPFVMEKFLVYQLSDFCGGGKCLLCNELLVVGHFDSKSHRDKAKNLFENFSSSLERYETFCGNIKNRLLKQSETIKKYNQLKEGKDVLSFKIGKRNCKYGFAKRMFLKKLALIESQPLKSSNENFFCEICDLLVSLPFVAKHTTDSGHLYHSDKWQELEKLATGERFFEPFQTIRDYLVCLLCGVSTKSFSHFFSHLKGTLHRERFKEYRNLKGKVPISSAIDIKRDLSVVCYCCDSLLLKRLGVTLFKQNLKVIRKHWPCPPVQKDLRSVKEIEKCRLCGNCAQVHHADCITNLLDFENVEIAFKEMVKACESVIFKRVMAKIKRRVCDNEKAIVQDGKQKQKADEMCVCGKPEGRCKIGSPSGYLEDPEAVGKNCEEIKMSPLKNRKSDKKKAGLSDAAEEKEIEILVISGLPTSEKIFDSSTKKLERFGKIQVKYRDGKSVIVGFAKKGIAEEVAACKNLFPEYQTLLTMSVELRKVSELEKSGLLQLLEEPSNLLDFVANLTVAATQASESAEELEREKAVCTTINSAILDVFPQCRCYPFGSRLSGLMFGNSDLDVFLDCGGMYEGMLSRSSAQELIHKVGKLLRMKKEVRNLIIITRARVPIISFLHTPTGLHCDLSFKNALSVHNTLLIKFLVSLDYQVKFIIIFLKHWVKENGIHGPPFFSSYAITMLAIFYLQQLNPPMLPTIEELQNAFVGRRLTIAGWDCSFSENATNFAKNAGDYPFQVILRGFFSYYENFEYDKFVISPVNGKPVPREAFYANSPLELPLCYKRQILNYPQPLEKLVCPKISLCVIDPFDLSHVLTKSFTPGALQLFKHFCHISAKALKRGALRMF